MIQKVIISGLKNIKHEEMTLKPLTLLTGLNSTGKSSVLQAILLVNKATTKNGQIYLDHVLSSFPTLRNIYENAKEVSISLETNENSINYKLSEETEEIEENGEGYAGLEIEKNLYYLSANRVGAENLAKISSVIFCGINGDYLLGTFEKEKSKPLPETLIKDESSFTLAAQLNYWQSYILGLKLELKTEKRNDQIVEVKYNSDNIPGILPTQLGAGVSYLTKVLILCLRATPGDVIMIENPEIHLHPAAQSRLGEFFAFIANAGIQLIIETHCDHLINKLQYLVFKKKFDSENTIIYYKKGIVDPFEKIQLNRYGRFEPEFPDGFFDATLAELIEME